MEFFEKTLENVTHHPEVIVAFVVALLAFKFIYELFEWFITKFGIETRRMREKREEHELLVATARGLEEMRQQHKDDRERFNKQDETLMQDIEKINNRLDTVSAQISTLSDTIDKTETAKLRERIIAQYDKFASKGEWTLHESQTFWGLFDRYAAHGGNSFVKDSIAPIMRELKISDID